MSVNHRTRGIRRRLDNLDDASMSNKFFQSVKLNDFPTIKHFDNPYSVLPLRTLQFLVRMANISLESLKDEIAIGLYEMDNIFPSWRKDVLDVEAESLDYDEILLGAALKGIDVNSLGEEHIYNMTTEVLLSTIISLLVYNSIDNKQVNVRTEELQTQTIYPTINKAIKAAQKGLNRGKSYIKFTYKNIEPIQTKQGAQVYYHKGYKILIGLGHEELNKILTDISKYPLRCSVQNYLNLWNLKIEGMRIALTHLGIDSNTVKIFNRTILIFIISRRYLPDIDLNSIMERYEFLSSQSPMIQNLLIKLYGINDGEAPMVQIAHKNAVLLENAIINIDKYTPSEIALSIGMIIPPEYDPSRYLLDNIFEYKRVMDRDIHNLPKISTDNIDPEHLSVYTDEEIISLMNTYVAYRSRENLINKICELAVEPNFFIPFKRNSINKETTVELNTVDDENVFMVAYGTLDKYFCMDMSDLMHSFVEYKTGGKSIFMFRDIQNLREVYPVHKIENLHRLLKRYNNNVCINTLIERIECGIKIVRNMEKRDFDTLLTIIQFNTDELHLIREYFDIMFDTGMYMRRWPGPGHPYPLSENLTLIKIDPSTQVTQGLMKMMDIYEKMSDMTREFIKTLTVYNIRKGKIIAYPQLFVTLFMEVFRGNECIRVSSTLFIGTSCHYSKLVFDTNAKININLIDSIA